MNESAYEGLRYFLSKSRNQASRVLSSVDPDKQADEYKVAQSWLEELDSLACRVNSLEPAKVVE